MVEKNSHKQIIITNLADVDLDSFVRIHMSLLLKGGKITKLYLEERFKYLLNDKGAIAIVARDNNGNFLGLVYGGAEGYKVEMDRIIRRKILSAFISQPRLLLNKEVCDKIIVRFKKVLKINPFVKLHIMIANKIKNPNEEVSSNKVVLSEPILRLTGIAVEKNDSNQGIGKKLIMEFERLGEIQKYKSIIVETSNQNIRAIEFYKRRGYKKYFYEGSNSNKAIFYKDLYSKNGVEGFEINFNHTEK